MESFGDPLGKPPVWYQTRRGPTANLDRATGAWAKRKSDSRRRNRARPRRAGLLAVSKSRKHSWRRGAPLHPSEQDDFAWSWTLSQIGGDPTTVRNEAMNAVTFAGGSASALST
jgi:hypothetical protein